MQLQCINQRDIPVVKSNSRKMFSINFEKFWKFHIWLYCFYCWLWISSRVPSPLFWLHFRKSLIFQNFWQMSPSIIKRLCQQHAFSESSCFVLNWRMSLFHQNEVLWMVFKENLLSIPITQPAITCSKLIIETLGIHY